jgi:uncharacterized protein YidB (DUF937 family)
MGLLDELGGALDKLTEEAAPTLISVALAKTNLGNLQGLVNQLQQGGLGDQVKSWLSNGSNTPITADQLKTVLNNQQVQQIAEHFGVPVDKALDMLAKYIPSAVDQASPNGTLQQ